MRMGELIFCSFRRAAKPYYLESAKQNIYSIEELCYFLQDNIYLLDENIMTAEFCDWLETELSAQAYGGPERVSDVLHADHYGFGLFFQK